MNWLQPLGENSFTDSWVKERVPVGGSGGGAASPYFISTWNIASDGDSITLPLWNNGSFDFNVDWGDGSNDNITVWNQAEKTHSYTTAGDYVVTINGKLWGFRFNNSGSKQRIKQISNWGNSGFRLNNAQAFFGCNNLAITATDAPEITTTSFSTMFYNCTSLGTPDLSAWDISTVTNMYQAFYNCYSFNGQIGTWNMSNVTSMKQMMRNCHAFNQDISSWDTSSCNDMQLSLNNCRALNYPIGGWNTSLVTTVYKMLENADAFRQSLEGWDVNQMTQIGALMQSATGLSTANYDATLIAWDAQGTMSFSGTVNFGGSKYTSGGAAEAARTSLITKWGGITDGGAA
jgi:surface protein